jgi:hypothetical protein
VEKTIPETERRKLRELARIATSLNHSADDTKLSGCAKLVGGLLRQGFHPIVWCRYIATSDYVAEGLRHALEREFGDVRVISINGTISDDERQAKVTS